MKLHCWSLGPPLSHLGAGAPPSPLYPAQLPPTLDGSSAPEGTGSLGPPLRGPHPAADFFPDPASVSPVVKLRGQDAWGRCVSCQESHGR